VESEGWESEAVNWLGLPGGCADLVMACNSLMDVDDVGGGRGARRHECWRQAITAAGLLVELLAEPLPAEGPEHLERGRWLPMFLHLRARRA